MFVLHSRSGDTLEAVVGVTGSHSCFFSCGFSAGGIGDIFLVKSVDLFVFAALVLQWLPEDQQGQFM